MIAFTLTPVLLMLERVPGPLLPQIEAALHAHGAPIRWAITAVHPRPDAASLLQIEAIVRGAADG